MHTNEIKNLKPLNFFLIHSIIFNIAKQKTETYFPKPSGREWFSKYSGSFNTISNQPFLTWGKHEAFTKIISNPHQYIFIKMKYIIKERITTSLSKFLTYVILVSNSRKLIFDCWITISKPNMTNAYKLSSRITFLN